MALTDPETVVTTFFVTPKKFLAQLAIFFPIILSNQVTRCSSELNLMVYVRTITTRINNKKIILHNLTRLQDFPLSSKQMKVDIPP